MKNTLLWSTSVVLSIGLMLAYPSARQNSPATQPATKPGSIAIEHVTVIPMARGLVRATPLTVIVRDGMIAEVGPSSRLSAPSDATRVDGRGKFLIPALAEMHAQIPGGEASDKEIERVLFLYAANGIGTVRGMLGDPRHLSLRERIARGELVGPMIYTSGPPFDGNSAPTADMAVKLVTEQKAAGYDFLKIQPGVKRDVFEALVATANKVGIRFAGHVPAEVGLNRALMARYATIDHFDGYMEALTPDGTAASPPQRSADGGPQNQGWLGRGRERPRHGERASGTPAPQSFGIDLVSRADGSRIASLVARTNVAGTHIVPAEILLENLYGPDDPETMAKRPEMRYADPGQVAQWVEQKRKMTAAVPLDDRKKFFAIRRTLIKALHEGDHHNAPILLGSDAPQAWNVPGFSIHRELATYVAAGLTPREALATGTRNVAAFFGTLDRAGTIEVGKRADLVLLDADPLAAISNTSKIAGVVLGGRWLPKSEIDRRLNEEMLFPKPTARSSASEAHRLTVEFGFPSR